MFSAAAALQIAYLLEISHRKSQLFTGKCDTLWMGDVPVPLQIAKQKHVTIEAAPRFCHRRHGKACCPGEPSSALPGLGENRMSTGSRDYKEQKWIKTGISTSNHNWLVVSTPLNNISQLGWLFFIYGKIKNVPKHQPDKDFKWPRWSLKQKVRLYRTNPKVWMVCNAGWALVRIGGVRFSVHLRMWKLSNQNADGTTKLEMCSTILAKQPITWWWRLKRGVKLMTHDPIEFLNKKHHGYFSSDVCSIVDLVSHKDSSFWCLRAWSESVQSISDALCTPNPWAEAMA